MGMYEDDFRKAVQKQADLIIQQMFVQLIQMVTESETWEDFRKRMYSLALSYIKDLEREGFQIPDTNKTVSKIKKED